MPCDLHTKDSLQLTDINLITHYPSQHCQLKKFIYFFFQNKKRRDVFESFGVLPFIVTLPLSSWVRVFILNGLPLIIFPSKQMRFNKGK